MTDELFPEWKYNNAGLRLGKPKNPWGDHPIDEVLCDAGAFFTEVDHNYTTGLTLGRRCRSTRTILVNESNEYIKGWQALIDEGALVLVTE